MKNVEKELRTKLLVAYINNMNDVAHHRLTTAVWSKTAEAIDIVTAVKNEVHFKLTHPKLT